MIERKFIDDLYTSYSRELAIYIYSFVKSSETAEDILHDLFVKIIKYSENHFIDPASARALLYKSARNLCIRHIQKNKKITTSQLEENLKYDCSESVEKSIEDQELMDRIHDLVDSRDPKTRSVFYMRTELNMQFKEIAEIMKISERTAKRKMSLVLSFLSESLENEGYSKKILIFMSFLL